MMFKEQRKPTVIRKVVAAVGYEVSTCSSELQAVYMLTLVLYWADKLLSFDLRTSSCRVDRFRVGF